MAENGPQRLETERSNYRTYVPSDLNALRCSTIAQYLVIHCTQDSNEVQVSAHLSTLFFVRRLYRASARSSTLPSTRNSLERKQDVLWNSYEGYEQSRTIRADERSTVTRDALDVGYHHDEFQVRYH